MKISDINKDTDLKDFEEKKLSSQLIYDGKIIHLYRDQVSLPNGKTAIREIIEHSGGSCIYCEKV